MTRALMLLIAAAAAAFAAELSPCKQELFTGYYSFDTGLADPCYVQNKADVDKFIETTVCSYMDKVTGYDAATCDPLFFNYMKCALKKRGLLNSNNTLKDKAFQTIALKNKCSTDTNFSKAYPKCKKSTMKYLNILRLFLCLYEAMP
ncbi:uncharacterized protein LOC108673159 [Hyalella azteca]|uniref:Uncharacterized protein LOC108673159 n=1 Tax=Hyalella azteca TaxID=294128 RepID=A0A8B7NRX4_HYAAZ|nr:uncharacterized protein LOC108673159 [Hyalella azteca]